MKSCRKESEEAEGTWVGVVWRSQPEVLLSQVLRHEGPPILGKAEGWHSRSSKGVVTGMSKDVCEMVRTEVVRT